LTKVLVDLVMEITLGKLEGRAMCAVAWST